MEVDNQNYNQGDNNYNNNDLRRVWQGKRDNLLGIGRHQLVIEAVDEYGQVLDSNPGTVIYEPGPDKIYTTVEDNTINYNNYEKGAGNICYVNIQTGGGGEITDETSAVMGNIQNTPDNIQGNKKSKIKVLNSGFVGEVVNFLKEKFKARSRNNIYKCDI